MLAYFYLVLALGFTSIAQAEVVGHIDYVGKQGSKVIVRGWACDERINKSISIHVYAGGPAGRGQIIGGTQANLNSEKAVKNRCKNNFYKHRFNYSLNASQWLKASGKKIFVHGIGKGRNLLIHNSGRFTTPQYNGPKVIGHIDGIVDRGSHLSLEGWACEKSKSHSIQVSIRAGSASGPELGTVMASRKSNEGVKRACATTYAYNRFSFNIEPVNWSKYRNQKIYVVGIKKSTPRSLEISKSGHHKIPRYKHIKLLSKKSSNSSGSLEIQSGERVVIDSSINLNNLVVNGELVCSNRYNRKSINIRSQLLMVHGKLICGTKSNPYRGKIDFSMKDGSKSGMGRRAFGAMMKGQILLHGDYKKPWSYLAEQAKPGQNYIYVTNRNNWKVGDEIHISSTGFNFKEAERARIRSIRSNGKIVLDRNLKHNHYGNTKSYDLFVDGVKKTRKYEIRASVANLTRNIRVKPDGSNHHKNQVGVHMMMMDNSIAKIDSIEISHGGQMGIMGRYPFHWHLMGNVNGQYFDNSSVHDSYQRCVTIHGTNHARVSNNACVNHAGHGYFLEDGSERKNIITGNLAMGSVKIPKERALLQSDFTGVGRRFPAPSSYWISNPDNYIKDNVASGSEGTGFWMSFENTERCNPDTCSVPIKTNTLMFSNNSAHSSKVGITWDGAPDGRNANNPRNENDKLLVSAHYRPGKKPNFYNLVAFKNSQAGIYFRGNAANYIGGVIADNTWGLFMAYSQYFKGSLVIGQSPYLTNQDKEVYKQQSGQLGGVIMYDGPFELDDVKFADFPNRKITHKGVDITQAAIHSIGGANKFVNRVRGIQFSPEPLIKIRAKEKDNGWPDAEATNYLYDMDGSLGMGGTGLIRQRHPFLADSSCANISHNPKHQNCDFMPAMVRIMSSDYPNNTFFKVKNPNGKWLGVMDNAEYKHSNKFPVRSGEKGVFDLYPGKNFASINQQFISYYSDFNNDLSPIIRLKGKSRCVLANRKNSREASRYNDLNGLRKAKNAGYVHAGSDTFIKLRATHIRTVNLNANFGETFVGDYRLNCK